MGHIKIIELFLAQNPDVNICKEDGTTPLRQHHPLKASQQCLNVPPYMILIEANLHQTSINLYQL
jgi:hypothetical protein